MTAPGLRSRWLGPLASRVEGWAGRRRGPQPRAGAEGPRVVAVHGLALGGAGKTPLCAWLAPRLAERLGVSAAVATRSRNVAGDEAAMLARRLPQVVVLSHDDPRTALAQARERGCGAVVLDDPSLSRPAPAHLRLLCLGPGDDWDRPVFPAGDRRPGALRPEETDWLVLFDGAPPPAAFAGPSVRATTVVRAAVPLAASGAPPARLAPGTPVFVLSGIARPARLHRAVESQRLAIAGFLRLPDHAPLPGPLRAGVEAWAVGKGAAAVITSEKDAARLPVAWGGTRLPWFVLPVDLALERDGRELLEIAAGGSR